MPTSDWRYAWVYDTMRKLESTIPVLVNEPKIHPQWSEENKDCPPMPPPAAYPLRPRPRASEYIRWLCERMSERKVSPMPHSISGPPYSLLVVEKPDASNAFSYGFGPHGGGGIVVYSGFLDDVMSKTSTDVDRKDATKQMPTDVDSERGWWSSLFGGILSRPSPLPPPSPTPTPEQTTELAILLAHELSHLVLSHHLESLSSSNVIIPGTISMAADLIRVLIFPITMIFGPFVNDALAQLGKVGSGELTRVGEWCTSQKQEIEADVVSARYVTRNFLNDAVRDYVPLAGSWLMQDLTLVKR
jgi:Peptidase family M48